MIAEQDIVEATILMLQEKLQLYFDDNGVDRSVPDITHGYSQDPADPTRNQTDAITVWCDSVTHDHFFQTKGAHNERSQYGIRYSFSETLQDTGKTKRLIGESIRRCVQDWWPAYFERVFKLTARMDYRFSSKYMQGGSRRGLLGSIQNPGNNNEWLLCAFTVWRREYANIQYRS